MKMIFLKTDSITKELVKSFGREEMFCVESLDQLQASLKDLSPDQKSLIFLDLDKDEKLAHKGNDFFCEVENIYRFFLTGDQKLKDLKKHQLTDKAAHGYIRKPLTEEIINGVLNDLELADHIAENGILKEGKSIGAAALTSLKSTAEADIKSLFEEDTNVEIDKFKNQENDKIQAKFDQVFESEESEQGEDEDGLDLFSGSDDLEFDNSGHDSAHTVASSETKPEELGQELEFDSPVDETLVMNDLSGLAELDGLGELEGLEEELDDELVAQGDTITANSNQKELASVPEQAEASSALEMEEDLDFDFGSDTNINPEQIKADNEQKIELPDEEDAGELDLDQIFAESEQEQAEQKLAADLEEDSDELSVEDLMDLTDGPIPEVFENKEVAAAEEIDLSNDDAEDLFSDSEEDEMTLVAAAVESEAAEAKAEADKAAQTPAHEEIGFSINDDEEDEFSAADFVSEDVTSSELTKSRQEGPSADDFFDGHETVANSPTPVFENAENQEDLHGNDALRWQATLKQMREERKTYEDDLKELKSDKKLLEQTNLNFRAEIEELKIEINIMQQRRLAEIEDLKNRLNLAEEKKQILEAKNKQLMKSHEADHNKVRVNVSKVKHRELELENRLELMTMDSESQLRTRDSKILELKRKIDALEFNMENTSIKEQKSRMDKEKLEDKMNKIMRTLSGSIKLLEDDLEEYQLEKEALLREFEDQEGDEN